MKIYIISVIDYRGNIENRTINGVYTDSETAIQNAMDIFYEIDIKERDTNINAIQVCIYESLLNVCSETKLFKSWFHERN